MTAFGVRLCFLALGVATMVACMPDFGEQVPVVNNELQPQNQYVKDMVNSRPFTRILLSSLDTEPGEVVLAQGKMGSVVQVDWNEVDREYRHRALLGKDDDDDDDDDDNDDEGSGVEVSAMVGVQVKQFRTPASWRKSKKKRKKNDEDEDDSYGRKKKSRKNSKLERDEDGNTIIVDTPVSPRFGDYVKKQPDFLDRIAYLGTTKRCELNAICKKVAKGKTKFKADVNVDEVDGAPDTGDDIEDAKVDHQFGCTITKGPKVKLNPKLKKGVVFALLELQGVRHLFDCQKGVKKCNIWELLDDEDAEDLIEEFAKEGKRDRGGRGLRAAAVAPAQPFVAGQPSTTVRSGVVAPSGYRDKMSDWGRCLAAFEALKDKQKAGELKEVAKDISKMTLDEKNRILKACEEWLKNNPDAPDGDVDAKVWKLMRGEQTVQNLAGIFAGGEEDRKKEKKKKKGE